MCEFMDKEKIKTLSSYLSRLLVCMLRKTGKRQETYCFHFTICIHPFRKEQEYALD